MIPSLSLPLLLILGLQFSSTLTFAFECPDDLEGQYGNSEDCTSFFWCQEGVAEETECPSGLYFNKGESMCDLPENSDCLSEPEKIEAVADRQANLQESESESDSEPRQLIAMKSLRGGETSTSFCIGRSDGIYRNPADCGTFFQCSHQQTFLRQCPSSLHFNEAIRTCDWPASAKCTVDVVTTVAPTTPEPEPETTTEEETTTTEETTTSTTAETTTQEETTPTSEAPEEKTTPAPSTGEKPAPLTKEDPINQENNDETAPAPDTTCSVCGLFGNPQDCTRYALCADGLWRELQCHAGLRFDTHSLECIDPEQANCASTSLMELSEQFA